MEQWQYEPARDHGMPLRESFRSLRREDGLVAVATHLLWWTLVHLYLAVVHRARIRGNENLPRKAPFVMIANHSSHLDVLLLASSLPLRLRSVAVPVAAGDTFFDTRAKSVFSAMALNALPLWRRSGAVHALRELRERITNSMQVLILFPEGTRSRDGQMGEFKPGIGMVVAGTHVPVVPCYLKGCYEALPPHRGFPRLKPISVHIGEPLLFSATPNTRDGWTEVAERCRAAVEQLKNRTRNIQ